MNPSQARLREQLTALKLLYVQEHYGALATEAAHKQWRGRSAAPTGAPAHSDEFGHPIR